MPNEPTAKAPGSNAHMNLFMAAEALEPGGTTHVVAIATGSQPRPPGGKEQRCSRQMYLNDPSQGSTQPPTTRTGQ